jgi:hypothetical protein
MIHGKKILNNPKNQKLLFTVFFQDKKSGYNEQTSLGVLLYSSTNYKRGDRPAKV